jgi:hypothetical protein
MKTLKSALALATINFGSGILGFWSWRLSGLNHQVGVQLPVTMVLGVTLVMLWFTRGGSSFGARSGGDYTRIMGAAFLVLVAAFVPLHFLLTGYLTSLGNILALGLVQTVQNILGMILAEARLRERAATATALDPRTPAD